MSIRRLGIVVIVFLVLGATAGVGVAAAAPAGATGEAVTDRADVTLTVTVTDAFNNPITDVTVTASWDGGSDSGETASNGKVFVDVPEGETVELTFQHRAYTLNNPVVVEDASEQEIEVTVYRKADASVAVTNAEGTPVENAKVTMWKRGEVAASGRTGADGVFESGTIEKGDYHVAVVKEGFYRNETDVTISGSASFGMTISEGTVPVTVTVKDSHFDPAKPIEGATIEVDGIGSLKTAAGGEQTVAVPVNSNVQFTITKANYTRATKTVAIDESSKSLSFTITRQDKLVVTPTNDQVVAGQKVRLEVVDEYDQPVAGAEILVNGNSVGTTNEDGVYQAALATADDYEISAQKEGVSSNTVTVEAVQPAAAATETAPPAESTPTTVADDSIAPVPGFGVPVALVAILAVSLLSLRRRR